MKKKIVTDEQNVRFASLFQVERIASNALSRLKGDLNGKYYPLAQLSPQDRERLTQVTSLYSSATLTILIKRNFFLKL